MGYHSYVFNFFKYFMQLLNKIYNYKIDAQRYKYWFVITSVWVYNMAVQQYAVNVDYRSFIDSLTQNLVQYKNQNFAKQAMTDKDVKIVSGQVIKEIMGVYQQAYEAMNGQRPENLTMPVDEISDYIAKCADRLGDVGQTDVFKVLNSVAIEWYSHSLGNVAKKRILTQIHQMPQQIQGALESLESLVSSSSRPIIDEAHPEIHKAYVNLKRYVEALTEPGDIEKKYAKRIEEREAARQRFLGE